jgi:hypothetical protein
LRPDLEGSKPDSGVNRSAAGVRHAGAAAKAELALFGGMVIAPLRTSCRDAGMTMKRQ